MILHLPLLSFDIRRFNERARLYYLKTTQYLNPGHKPKRLTHLPLI